MSEGDLRKPLVIDRQQGYDPFSSPPNFQLAERHKLAMSVGTEKITTEILVQRCPCCHHAIFKTPLLVFTDEIQFCFLGVGHPLYYRLTKYFAAIILLVLITSGGLYVLVQNLQCSENCAVFFGIPIMEMESLDDNPELKAQWFNLLTCMLLMIGVLYVKPRIHKDIEQFRLRLFCPSAYTVMLQNMPSVSEDELKQWITQIAETPPCKINISYDLTPYQQAYSKKQDIVFKLNSLKIQGENIQLNVPFNKDKADKIERDIDKFNQQLEKQNKVMREFNSEAYPPKPSGTVFVTFNDKITCETLIKKWGDSFTKSLVNCLFGYIRSPYPICRKQYVLVSRAPSPTDVIWQNLSFSFIRNIFFEVLAYLMMAVIILIAFKLQYYMVTVAFELKMQGKQPGKFFITFLSISMSFIVLILNMLLRLVIQQFCRFQRYYSYTKYSSSFANSYLLMYFINTCFTVYIVHGNWLEDSEQILLWDIHLIMLTNAFSEPFAKLFDPTMLYRHFMRWRIQNKNPSPYTQKYVNSVWEGHPMSIADNYQYISRMLLITIWFTCAAPLGAVFSLSAMLLNYWIDKLFLVRVNKIPESVSEAVADRILMILELLPLVYMCGTLQYTYKFGESSNVFEFLAKFLNYGIVLVVILLTMLGYALFWKQEPDQPSSSPVYQEAQYLFLYDYDSENPITRYQSQISFLNRLLQSRSLDKDSNLTIQNVLSKLERKESIQDIEQSRSQIIQIKQRLANERLQWHKYNKGSAQLMSLSKSSSANSQDRQALPKN